MIIQQCELVTRHLAVTILALSSRTASAHLSDSSKIPIHWELGVMSGMFSRHPLESAESQTTRRLGNAALKPTSSL